MRVDDFDDLFLDAESTDSSVLTSNDPLPDNCDVHAVQRLNFCDIAFPYGVKRLVPADLHLIDSNERRKIYLDLSTRTLMASGPTIDVMVRTKVGHYIDFRPIESTFVAFDADGLRKVPCSRADVFQNRYISMLEKRLLMRFIKASSAAMNPSPDNNSDEEKTVDESKSNDDETMFEEHMQLSGLTDKLKAFFWHAVVLGGEKDPKNTPVSVATNAIVRFQNSLMRFGTPTPFLYSNHGAAEIAQAFCRMCAVKGGTYVLRRGVSAIVTEDEKVTGVVTEAGEFLRCKALFSSVASKLGGNISAPVDKLSLVWRAVCVVDGSLVRGNEKRALIVVPKGTLGNSGATVRIFQLDSAVAVCPEGKFVIHAQTTGSDGVESDLMNVLKHYTCLYNRATEIDDAEVEREGNDECPGENNAKVNGIEKQKIPPSCEATKKPRVLWGVMYSRDTQPTPSVFESQHRGLNFLAEGGSEIDGEFCVDTARLAFEKVMPGAIFFGAEDEEKIIEEQPELGNVEEHVDPSENRRIEKSSVIDSGVEVGDHKTVEVGLKDDV